MTLSSPHCDIAPTKLRADLQVIADWIPEGSRVLDVGCGQGELLHWLACNKQVDGRGLEMEQQNVVEAVAKGLAVIQGDANIDVPYYPTNSVDYVVMGHTLQRMNHPDKTLCELVRIGKKVIVSMPNFAYWYNRYFFLSRGRMPVSKNLPYEWYETPNIHFCSLTDFVRLCEKVGVVVEKRIYVTHQGKAGAFSGQDKMANFFGEQGIFLISGAS
ncbi:MAG: methionine biosynthesis protein MetW [Alphaproteobacteria bacterium]|nr:methionine biosynthesis protein MetW [Alphaproteobacteria bacterium]